jgi:transcriptional regulator with XRE-family HTH domain
MAITPHQIRAARALLKWSQNDLADRSGVSLPAIANIENEKQRANNTTQEKIARAFGDAGIEFIEGGLRQVQDLVRVFEGDDCYLRMLDEAFIILSPIKGEILFSASDERRTPPNVLEKFRAMRTGGITFRSLIKNQDTYLMGLPDEYRWMDDRIFVKGDVKAIFGDCVAYLMTWKDQKKVIVIKDNRIADEQRRLFDFVWNISATPTHSTSDIKYEGDTK